MAEAVPTLPGDWFKLKQAGDNGRFSFFKVMRVGGGVVTVYGGDLDPGGRRQFHSYTEERLAAEARPLTPRERMDTLCTMKPVRPPIPGMPQKPVR